MGRIFFHIRAASQVILSPALRRVIWETPMNRSIAFPADLVVAFIFLVGTSFAQVPTSVTIAGDLQQELGCGGDWDPACAATHLAYDATDDVWQGTFNVPAGNWQ